MAAPRWLLTEPRPLVDGASVLESLLAAALHCRLWDRDAVHCGRWLGRHRHGAVGKLPHWGNAAMVDVSERRQAFKHALWPCNLRLIAMHLGGSSQGWNKIRQSSGREVGQHFREVLSLSVHHGVFCEAKPA